MPRLNAFKIVKDFEDAVAEYCGAPFCVAVNSCTNALFLALKWKMTERPSFSSKEIYIPKYTYLSVPMQIKHAGFGVKFENKDWIGSYELYPLNIWDSARRFTSNMYIKGSFMCTSHHYSKILNTSQAGCILHDDKLADDWLRRARFDGRAQGIAPKDDNPIMGWHMYLSPEVAAQGLVKLMHLPKHNKDLPNDEYPDLSRLEIFK